MTFDVIESVHVLGIGLMAGTVAIVDLRLLGLLLKKDEVSDVVAQVLPLTWLGFICMVISGSLLFWSEAAKCYKSPAFRIKMIFLLLAGLNAVLFESTLGRTTATWDNARVLPSRARLAGWASLICWAGVVICGRWTAYGLS